MPDNITHFPVTYERACLPCRIRRFLFGNHGHYPKEISTEELRAVLAEPE